MQIQFYMQSVFSKSSSKIGDIKIKKFKSLLLSRVKLVIPYFIRVMGIKLLTKSETHIGLSNFIYSSSPKYQFKFKNLSSINSSLKTLEGESPASNIFEVQNIDTDVLPFGGLRINKNIYDLDFGNSLFLKYVVFKKRRVMRSQISIVLWSHEWGTGYYDFLFFIAMKLNRILLSNKNISIKDTLIQLPFKTIELPDFVYEYLSILGFDKSQVIDSREIKVIATKYIFADNNSFFLPNFYDVISFKNHLDNIFLSLFNSTDSNKVNLYLKRSSRRIVKNENEIIPILVKYNFEIIEDITMSIFDQYKLFRSANIILGPHGAGFSNIIFCQKDTKVVEFFPENYYPPYYFYLSGILGLDYFGFIENGNQLESHYSNVECDLSINPTLLEELLIKIC